MQEFRDKLFYGTPNISKEGTMEVGGRSESGGGTVFTSEIRDL